MITASGDYFRIVYKERIGLRAQELPLLPHICRETAALMT